VFVDTLVGGGLVLNSQPHAGVYGNAGAIRSMPLGAPDTSRPGGVQQLLACASLATLDEMPAAVGPESSGGGRGACCRAPWAPSSLRHARLS
jgi:predicted NBD/HSP70 family sugar kinase